MAKTSRNFAGFVLALISGIKNILMGVIIGFSFLLEVFLPSNRPYQLDGSKSSLLMIILCAWLLIFGVISIFGAVNMNKEDYKSVKKGSIMALTAGILSLSMLSIIGGILGLTQLKK